MTQAKNYKESLNLPKTAFPMKANLAQREPEMLKAWNEKGVYESIRKQSASKKKYILHDGPPYANGLIHIGHALNKILKDIIVKFKTMQGHDALYIPGWDCHGLPIEYQCLKKMGKRKEDVERVPFRKEARRYAQSFIGKQREDFKRLGIFGEWETPYLTMDYAYQASIADSFLRLAEDGYIYQGLKPVPWCFDCETALADAELEYEDKTSTSVYVAFPVKGGKAEWTKLNNLSYLVWTTTPWTLPANVGLAFHPDLDYVVAKTKKGCFVFAEALTETILAKLELDSVEVIEKAKGKAFEGLEAQHPFLKRVSNIILADYVSATDGTGIVHIAPGHGEDDYYFGHMKNKLPIVSPVDSRGRFTEEFPEAQGIHVFKANEKIVEILEGKKALLAKDAHKHSYPHCWRCKKPIIFRATHQWFMKIDHKDLRKKMLNFIENKVQFTPEWGKKRIGSMVQTRPEWCLSRQRYWGVPIPMIGCAACKDTFFVSESRPKIREAFQKEGADSWFEKPAEDFLPSGFKCSKCGGKAFKKEEDIIDVWFDSGVSHQAVLKQTEGLQYPADLYLEGSDQHRGWFQSALTTSVALEGKAPFQGVLTHGFVVDGNGKKMSKSAGNVVVPQDIMKQYGVDILRLWVSSCDYQFDVRLSQDIIKQLADSYRKIRNTFRYILGNLEDFDIEKDSVPVSEMHPWDRWAVEFTNQIQKQVIEKYDRFEFHQIYQLIHNFCVLELSGYYFDGLKDILYTYGKTSQRRRSAQSALFYILSHITKLLAPILPFTTDEVWKTYPIQKNFDSVHESQWGGDTVWAVEEGSYATWQDVRNIRNAVTPFLEKKREAKEIGANLDAKVTLFTKHPKAAEMIQEVLGELPAVFVVSQVEWAGSGGEAFESASYESKSFSGETISLHVQVEKADGKKCVRCWNYSDIVGTSPEHPELCGKCLEALK